jgi:hypothetical protein
MQSSRPSDVQIGAGTSKHDTSVQGHDTPTAEALSRWENDGGAPDRRGSPAIVESRVPVRSDRTTS